MIINAGHQTGLSSSPPMNYACARVALLEAQPPQERPPYHQPAEQSPPERLPYHQQAEQHRPFESCDMDYIDVHHHQYKHHHHHHHNHLIQQQALQHHHPYQFPIGGGYAGLGGGFIASEASPVSFDIASHVEKEKQGLPQNQYVDQCGSAQASYEDAHLLSKVCEDAHVLPGRLENLHLVYDGRYSQQHRFQSSSSTSVLVVPHIKVLCSIGGRIMGRPVDGKLRYCGGDTRLITVDGGTCFSDLMGKLSQMYGSALTLKYQLPGEDLDALVSVSSDDDLQNMLDEYDKMVATGDKSWFRLFLFRIPSDCEIFSDINASHERGNCYSEIMQRYINAINGFSSKGASEHPSDVQLENDHHLPSRMGLDLPYTTFVGSYLATKPSSQVPSAPSSPSVAAMQAHHKQCGTGDICLQISKDQHCYVTPMSGIEVNAQELSQDRHVDTLQCDYHQGHILGESPRMQHDPPFSRGDALWVKEHGAHYIDLEDTGVHQLEGHRGTGTIVVDTLPDVPKPFGVIDSRCEAYCGNPLAGQSLTSLAYHGGQVEGDFGRSEPVQHCYVEGHKQVPLLHQLHQTGSLMHWEGLARSQRGPGIESTCQTADGQGHSPFLQEPAHIHLQHANVMSSIPLKAMSSAPSSPRNVYHGRCCCCQQHFQVDRGISVSLGEHSHSKKPPHFGDQSIRRHGLPFLSRFCDASNFCSDSTAWRCLPTLKKGLEFDEEEHEASLRKHRLGRIKTRRQPGDCGANDCATHSFMEPVHSHCEGSLHRCRFCCDTCDTKGQRIGKARVFPTPEFQAYMGECDVHPGIIEESINMSTAGRLTNDKKAVLNLERGIDSVMGLNSKNGQVDMETSIQDGCDVSGYGHMHASNPSSMLGHGESGFNFKTESFSSTDAVAGSLSRPSLEPPVWVVSPPLALHDDHSKEREAHEISSPVELMASTRQLVDGTLNNENTGDTCRSPSFGRMDPYTRVRSTSTAGDACERRVEKSPVSSLIHVPEEKISISNAHGSQPKFDHFCSVSSSQPFTARTLESDSFKESAILALPIYDSSPLSSVNNSTFSFAQREEKSVSNGKEVPEQCVNSRSTHIATPYQGQHLEIAKAEADHTAPHEQETMPVLEELRSLSRPSSRQCSVESVAPDKGNLPPEVVPVAQNSVTNEVNVSGSLYVCTEEDEKELPATQAEAEAIARGLQIIKNDDLEDLKELGSGTYGTVFHGKWRGSDVAIKRIKASCFTGRPSEQERLISDFWREAGTLSQLHHPNIVAFYGVVPDGPGGTLATVTEYMVNGSLKQVLVKKDRTIDRRKRLLIAMDAAFGMEYLHSKRIVHFDLKSENLLVNMRDAHRPICKVGDFGLSKVKHQTLVSGGVRGTLPWMAPELLSTKGLVTEKVDVYSFGIVMWELLTGEEPYANMHCGTIIGGIVNNNLRPAIPCWCDPSWRNLMERCWSGNPADRPNFSAVASELRGIALSMNVK